jgi:UDP-N-acetylmuramoyl-tripeptide--D-alanyl-D-alanine ligase
MRAALLNFEKQTGEKTVILGDMFELGNEAKKEHQTITDLISILDLNQIILIGENFYQSHTNSKNQTQYKSFEEFKNNFDFSKIKNQTILIKGSRGMALERILQLL